MNDLERIAKTIEVLTMRNRLETLIERLEHHGQFKKAISVLELAIKKLEDSPPDVRGAIDDVNVANLVMDEV